MGTQTERLEIVYVCQMCKKLLLTGLYVDSDRLTSLIVDAQKPEVLVHVCDEEGKVGIAILRGAIPLTHHKYDEFYDWDEIEK
jgi:hypothetical protein